MQLQFPATYYAYGYSQIFDNARPEYDIVDVPHVVDYGFKMAVSEPEQEITFER